MELFIICVKWVDIVLIVILDPVPFIHFLSKIVSFFFDGLKFGLELSLVLLMFHHLIL